MTREEAIKFLYHIADEAQAELESNRRTCTNIKRLEALNMAISALREQSSATQRVINTENALNKWIPVTERLPEDEGKVLACYGFDSKHDGNLGMMFVGTLTYFCFDNNPHWQHSSCSLVVTHWMPLPEPPEVEV